MANTSKYNRATYFATLVSFRFSFFADSDPVNVVTAESPVEILPLMCHLITEVTAKLVNYTESIAWCAFKSLSFILSHGTA